MKTDITEYNEFVKKLKSDLESFHTAPKQSWIEVATRNVDGLASEELRRLVSLEKRRKHGAFFTNTSLANKVLLELQPLFNNESLIYDPACGAGNLLISISNYVSDLNLNIETQLFGTDIHKEFVEATRLRLMTNFLLKETTCCDYIFNNQRNKKYQIEESSGLLKNKFYDKATHIFVNPPFNQIDFNEKLSWAKGKVSAAAIFIDRIIKNAKPGVSIIAILPDVLRSGSRYGKWREMIKNECEIEKLVLLGQFDKYADVDVFAIALKKNILTSSKKNKKSKLELESRSKNTIQDIFKVCVGPVVDNRDEHLGRRRGYIVSKKLLGWSVLTKYDHTRRYQGRYFKAPFVVIKRTSRMGDSQRAIATIINTPNPVFVDNHLIVLQPRSGKMEECQKVLKVLKDKRTDDWLNDKIRCRHLTTTVVSKIPFWL